MKNKKILVFSPHADDVEIAMGGTMAKLCVDNDIVLVTCILPTEDRAGNHDQQMIDNRGIEQAKAAKYTRSKITFNEYRCVQLYLQQRVCKII